MRQLRRWLSRIRYARILTTGVAFVAGVLATGIIHTFTTTELLGTPQGVKWGIIAFLALIVALCVVLIIEYHTRVLNTLETKFGLQAEFIMDRRGGHKGLSYKAVQKNIEAANKNLIFVDSWVKSSEYGRSKERRDYYRAIEDRIRKHLNSDVSGSDWFYRRIVQVPDDMELEEIKQDVVYAEHLKECAHLEKEDTTGTIYVGIANAADIDPEGKGAELGSTWCHHIHGHGAKTYRRIQENPS
jgi:hypothetical protein